MDLQQLRYVVEVASTASFTRAAERCFVTQSALSHQIAALEREIGQRLFLRSSRRVQLTEAGEAFLVQARIAVAAADRAAEDAEAADGQVIGTLRIGVIPTVTAIDVPATLVRFRSAHPTVRVELRGGNSDDLVSALRRGEIDVALLGLREGSAPRGVASRVLSRDALVLVMPRSHRLSGRRSLALADTAGEIFADFPTGTSGREQSDVAYAAAGIERDVAFEADSAPLILGLVTAGLAITLLAPGVVSASPADVTTATVDDGPHRTEYVAWDERAPRNVARAFLELLSIPIEH